MKEFTPAAVYWIRRSASQYYKYIKSDNHPLSIINIRISSESK